jgi:hypothetical protein
MKVKTEKVEGLKGWSVEAGREARSAERFKCGVRSAECGMKFQASIRLRPASVFAWRRRDVPTRQDVRGLQSGRVRPSPTGSNPVQPKVQVGQTESKRIKARAGRWAVERWVVGGNENRISGPRPILSYFNLF